MAHIEQHSARLTQPKRPSWGAWRLPVLAGASIFIIIWISILIWKWPFSERAVAVALEHEALESVHIGAFHATFFPLGYVAENIRFAKDARSSSRASEITISKLVIVASWFDLLTMHKRLERVSLAGCRVIVPSLPPGSRKRSDAQSAPPRFSEIEEVDLKDSSIEFAPSEPAGRPFSIAVKDLTIHEMSGKRSGPFKADVSISKPQGAVRLTGQIGPWEWNDMSRTRLSGSFEVQHADLNSVGSVEGLLGIQGKFAGQLSHVACSGSADVPQFRVAASAHTFRLYTTFAATINGITGDATLDHADSHLNSTLVQSKGDVKEDAHHEGKTTSLRFSVEEGQIGDLLLLFTKAPQPSMAGTVDLRLDAEIPPGDPSFLKKLRLAGDFGIDRGHFTKRGAQDPLNQLSESARGMSKDAQKQDTQTVLSDLSGHVSAQGGIATLSRVSFTIPGGHASVFGTYNLLNQGLHLQGTLRTTGKLSDTTSGLKAAMLKVLVPFLKKRSVTVVPFVITGTAQHPALSLDLLDKHHS